jgi:hypothetical protein
MAALTFTLDCDVSAFLAALDSARRAGAVIDPKDGELFEMDFIRTEGRLILLPSQKLLDAIGQGKH